MDWSDKKTNLLI